jgi:glycosyltransferase involved in cell wall biosynthesis
VNIQFEAGLYGGRIKDIYRRIKMIIDAAPNLTLTMHRVDTDLVSLLESIVIGIKTRSYKNYKKSIGAGAYTNLTKNIIEYCKKYKYKKNIWIKVHTKRDAKAVRIIFKNDRVFDYPLVFLSPDIIENAWSLNDRKAFLEKYGFEEGDKLIGLFGYLSEYKVIETVINALDYLPKNYKIGLFGSQHPQTVKRNQSINPYLESLFDLMNKIDLSKSNLKMKEGKLDWLKRNRTFNDNEKNDKAIFEKIVDRIKFVGNIPDPEFIEALRLCDAVALPYLEVGQSMSGVVVLGLESGAKLICSNNFSFFETAKYYPDTFLRFDIGNYYELSQKVIDCATHPIPASRENQRKKCFQYFNIDTSIRLQLEKFGHKLNTDEK